MRLIDGSSFHFFFVLSRASCSNCLYFSCCSGVRTALILGSNVLCISLSLACFLIPRQRGSLPYFLHLLTFFHQDRPQLRHLVFRQVKLLI